MSSWDIGDEIHLTVTSATEASTPKDPDSITLTIRPPAAAEADDIGYAWPGSDIEQLATGSFRRVFVPTVELGPGTYAYRWKFDDDETDPALTVRGAASDQFTVLPLFAAAFTPTVNDVAELLRARTKDDVDVEIGTFNENTRPTASQVEGEIRIARQRVLLRVGGSIPLELADSARDVVCLKAAQLVEQSYLAEQTGDDRTIHGNLRLDYEAAAKQLALSTWAYSGVL